MLKIFLLGITFSAGAFFALFVNHSTESERPVNLPTSLSEIISSSKIFSGDIVFRLGHGYISETLKSISRRDKRYSHAGIISIEHGVPYVYHLIGSESDAATLRKEMLTDFCLPSAAQSYSLYHITLNNLQKEAVDSLNHYYYHCALPFDKRFDMDTDSAMYCTEYVYKILFRASGGDFLVTSSELSGFRFIGCDDLYLNPKCEKIFAYTYENE
ncbi:MAG TPA: hypothetical protein VI757_10665 [Bacteroidia bacterium]|nr:hypothetical protein [Bacteroidia bacterium]